MLSLKNVLMDEKIKEGIKVNLLKDDKLTEEAIEKTIDLSKNDTLVNITMNGEEMEFTNTLHYSNDEYLLESRLFETNGGMVNAYLPVFDKNMKFNEQEIDDVWDYSNWSVVKDIEIKNIFKKL